MHDPHYDKSGNQINLKNYVPAVQGMTWQILRGRIGGRLALEMIRTNIFQQSGRQICTGSTFWRSPADLGSALRRARSLPVERKVRNSD